MEHQPRPVYDAGYDGSEPAIGFSADRAGRSPCSRSASSARAPPARPRKPAPEPQQPQHPVFRAGTGLVRVDVTVTTATSRSPTCATADFEVTEDERAAGSGDLQFVRVDGERKSDLNEPAGDSIARARRARGRRATTSGCSRSSWTTTTSTSGPTSRCRCARRSRASSTSSGPNDLAVMMDPLTTLDDLKYTRSKADLLEPHSELRRPARRGLSGQERGRGSADDAAQLAGAARPASRCRRSTRSPRSSAACARAASRSCSSARARPCAPAARTTTALEGSDAGGQSRQRHHSRARSAAARHRRVRRRRHAAADRL